MLSGNWHPGRSDFSEIPVSPWQNRGGLKIQLRYQWSRKIIKFPIHLTSSISLNYCRREVGTESTNKIHQALIVKKISFRVVLFETKRTSWPWLPPNNCSFSGVFIASQSLLEQRWEISLTWEPRVGICPPKIFHYLTTLVQTLRTCWGNLFHYLRNPLLLMRTDFNNLRRLS